MAAWVPQPDLVVYGNYMEDLEPADIKTDDSGETTMAKPRVSRQFEVGVRKNWGNFVTTLNAFQIKRPGYWRGHTTTKTTKGVTTTLTYGNNSDFARYKAQGGAAGDEQGMERNRGIEFNTYANLLNNTLRPTLGLMYLQSTVKEYPNSRDMLVNGVQVANPRVIAKAGLEWDTPFAKGLTLNSNVSYFGKSYQDTQKQYAFLSYTLVDVGALQNQARQKYVDRQQLGGKPVQQKLLAGTARPIRPQLRRRRYAAYLLVESGIGFLISPHPENAVRTGFRRHFF